MNDQVGWMVHVVPVADLRPHETEFALDCWCEPEVNDHGIIIHHAADGREGYQSGQRKPQ